MGKNTSFLCVHSRVSHGFSQTNRPEPARKVVQDDKFTHTNLYEGTGMIFSASLISFLTTTEPQTWENTSFLSVHSRVSHGFTQTNRPEPARKVDQDDKVTDTHLHEGPGMIFQPLLSRFRLLQSLRH